MRNYKGLKSTRETEPLKYS